ncbi:MAG: hypothetical protein IT428_10790 [Planctomycetaceae bacterium]|nr:hypothetical protein [Planctomycetaceae bacterium]
MHTIEFSDVVHVGSQPTFDDIEQLIAHGFKGMINLRSSDEPSSISSRDEGVFARERGLFYLSFPVAVEEITPAILEDFRTKLGLMPHPVFVHSAAWEGAAVLVLIDRALQSGWNGIQTLKHAESIGLRPDETGLRELVGRFVPGVDKE